MINKNDIPECFWGDETITITKGALGYQVSVASDMPDIHKQALADVWRAFCGNPTIEICIQNVSHRVVQVLQDYIKGITRAIAEKDVIDMLRNNVN